MSEIKLYKKFYRVGIVKTGSTIDQTYTLLDPFILSANTYSAGSGATESNNIIEAGLLISQESSGVYFADLNPLLYASDISYDLVWFVNYTSTAPIKKISTRFRFNVNKYTNQIELEIINAPLEIELFGKY